ncbi:MAG: nucleotidyltransferase domain-containing protein [Candidatus Jordarchaeales archaeon]|nr:nucleotidyltransferase domain-containing protein [Candidatus Jordarchaeia archaeon]
MGKATSAVRSQEEALSKASEFVESVDHRCAEKGYRLLGAYLVGSRARGDYLEDSDVDIVLVIDGVAGLNRLERLGIIKDLLLPGVEVFVYTQQEWNSDSLWIMELRKEAIPIARRTGS